MKIPHYLTRLLYFAIVSLTVFAAACKDEKEPDPEPVDNNPIVGTWQLKEIKPETVGTPIPDLEKVISFVDCIYNLKLTFNANNTISTADCPIAVAAIESIVPVGAEAKWKVSGDKLTLSDKNRSQDLKITQNATDLNVVVNTELDATKPPVNAVLYLKRI
ncbi:lipocalin-like domain-containing protein [Dyadobacter aurulentus]|uniref:lipocalin family protein n=1 Tax=Dyadobacter sp. UC 10 TaxID=2605428 RepID=UPI0011F186EF|nr:lipocalin family protein [Dyadobacter sp. UC 10]KAA0990507.1 lipocalin family protein [Dyadobacter sp. UC 10]